MFLLFNVLMFRLHHHSLHQSSTLYIQNHGNDMANKYNLKFKRLLRGRRGHVVVDEMPFQKWSPTIHDGYALVSVED